MQIIIIGGSEIGYALAKALASDHELCVLDTEPGVADRFGLLDVEFLTGSGTSSSLLERARVSTCELLIACTGLDEVNIVACSIGSQLGCRRTICFVSKEDFVHTSAGRADGQLRAPAPAEQAGTDRHDVDRSARDPDCPRAAASRGLAVGALAPGRARLMAA